MPQVRKNICRSASKGSFSCVRFEIRHSLELTNSKDEKRGSNQVKAPPYDGSKLEKDPKLPPAKGFEWRGKGAPSSKYGSWYNSNTEESLRSDFDHPPPIKPHWDYLGPSGDARLYLDGKWEFKR